MENAFAWLGDLIHWIGKLIPRLLIIEATHAGLAFVRGRNKVPLHPGLHVYWPIWTHVHTYPTARQTVNLPTQTLMTQDDKRVIVGGIVVYEIHDIVAALGSIFDLDDTIRDISLAAIKTVIVSHTTIYIRENYELIDTKLTEELSSKLEPFGVTVVNAYLSDFSTCLVLRMVGQENSPHRPPLGISQEE